MKLKSLMVLVVVFAVMSPALTVVGAEEWWKKARGLKEGETLVVAEGRYATKGPMTLEGLRGTAERPITVRAAGRGKVVIGGAAGFLLRDCEHVVLEGFRMENDADQQAFRLENCRYVRVTRNTLRLTERAKPRHWEHWVTVDGTRSGHNRIDHNLFEAKVNRGSPVFVRGDDAAMVCSQHDRVDHNHFRDQPWANKENGHETIRTGGNDLGAAGKSSFTVIESNLLERCSGEDEIMSLKSSDNYVRYNTLINCRGAICLRLGNGSEISGNFILATEEGPAFGGIKVYGFEHQIFNNYFCGLTGRRHEAPFSLDPGTMDAPTTDRLGKDYDDMTSPAPTRCWVVHNTWVDCAALQFGYKPEKERPCTPLDNVFINNLVVRTGTRVVLDAKSHPQPLVILDPVRGMWAEGNVAWDAGSEGAEATGWAGWFKFVEVKQPVVAMRDGLWRVVAGSAVVDAGVVTGGSAAVLKEDAFGRARRGMADVGAEEFGAGAGTDVRGPLKAGMVGLHSFRELGDGPSP